MATSKWEIWFFKEGNDIYLTLLHSQNQAIVIRRNPSLETWATFTCFSIQLSIHVQT